MALRKATSLLQKTNLSKSESILYNAGRPLDSTTFVNKYKSILNSYNFDSAIQLLQFPSKLFHKFPSSILKKLIRDSFNIVNDKAVSNSERINTPNIDMYNILLSNYVDNEISFPVNDILLEMKKNNIIFNTVTFMVLLKNYTKIGEMSTAEYLLEQMKLKDIKINKSTLIDVVTGYIMTGQTDKAESIIAEHKIEESPDLIIGKAKGYASKGDVNNVMECIRKIDNSELISHGNAIFNIYARLIQSKVPRSNLDELLRIMKEVAPPSSFCEAIFYLNRVGLYSDSLHLLEMFQNLIYYQVDHIITSFISDECPFNTYKEALTILLKYRTKINNIFVYMNFDEAFLLAESVIKPHNDCMICESLLRKAIYDKSISEVSEALRFCKVKLNMFSFNMTLLCNFIPSMLESGMVSNCKELIQSLPQFKKSLLAASLMHCLMKRNFPEVSQLKAKYKPKGYLFISNYQCIAQEVVDNLCSTEIDRFAVEVGEIFDAVVFDSIMKNIIYKKVNLAAKIGNEDGMKNAVALAETYQLTLSNYEIKHFIERHPDQAELLKSLFEKHVRTSGIDNSSANVIVEPTESTENQSETVS